MNSLTKYSQYGDVKFKANILLIEDLLDNNNITPKSIGDVVSDSSYEVGCTLSIQAILDKQDINPAYHKGQPEAPISILQEIEQHNPDVIVINVHAPRKSMIKSLQHISQYYPRPIVMFSEQEGSDYINLLIQAGVTSYITGGVDANRIKSILATAIAQFNQYKALKEELNLVKSKLLNQRIIEQAKLLLMQNKNYTEQRAYHSIRKMAMDKGEKVEDVAKNILSLASIL